MKKIFKFAFVIFIFAQVASAKNFSQNANALLSFNVNGMQKNHRLETNPKWADTITKIILESDADIVCLQEVCIDLEKRRDTALFKNPKKNNVLDYFTKRLREKKNVSGAPFQARAICFERMFKKAEKIFRTEIKRKTTQFCIMRENSARAIWQVIWVLKIFQAIFYFTKIPYKCFYLKTLKRANNLL